MCQLLYWKRSLSPTATLYELGLEGMADQYEELEPMVTMGGGGGETTCQSSCARRRPLRSAEASTGRSRRRSAAGK